MSTDPFEFRCISKLIEDHKELPVLINHVVDQLGSSLRLVEMTAGSQFALKVVEEWMEWKASQLESHEEEEDEASDDNSTDLDLGNRFGDNNGLLG